MPIYVYECEACGERFEYTQSMAEPPKTVCEKCAGHLVKVIAPTAFVLKGGGWYKDLYSSSKGKSGGSDTKSDSSSTSSGSTETKTETKTESKKPEATTTTKSDKKD